MNNLKLYEKMNNEIIKALFADERSKPIRIAVESDADGEEWVYWTIDGYVMYVMPKRFFHIDTSSKSEMFKETSILSFLPKTMTDKPILAYINTNCDIFLGKDEKSNRAYYVNLKMFAKFGKIEDLCLYADSRLPYIIHVRKGGVYVGLVYGRREEVTKNDNT